MWTWKKLTVPESNETKQIDVVQLWEVRWNARDGQWHNSTYPVMEAFTSLEGAQSFRDSLVAAFKLTRNTNSEEAGSISITKSKSV